MSTLSTSTQQQVRDYYGRVLKSTKDLKTDACCSTDAMPPHLRRILDQVAGEIRERFYGCGSPIPPAIEGCTVLDLGCGTGRDAYLCARLVGPQGRVIGVDMTEAQLEVARRHETDQARRFGYDRPNTLFHHGYMEDLAALGIEDGSVDVVISNCVINLAPDKERVFAEIFRVLKPGGELYFSDIFADRRLPAEWMEDPVLVGECLAGAMYVEDFRRLIGSFGIPDVRVVASREVRVDNPELARRVGAVRFRSMTVRVFKLDDLEDRCEDYGQVAYYRGTMPFEPHRFVLDDHHVFETDRPVPVCGNTASMLTRTRFASHFRVDGDRRKHFGLFPCGTKEAADGGCDPGTACC
ncbi:MAG: methyltransferase domain-containing protein [Planctomycetota bacterium]|nr:MAG: methyltransferase domain-containing protein [Planctomycetota bacterium]